MNGLEGIIAINKGAKLNKLIRRNRATNGITEAEVSQATKAIEYDERRARAVKANRKGRTGV